jgi:thiosulfate/3-mercaptopyruvate sulfurtransferase
MNWRISIVVVVLAFTACKEDKSTTTEANDQDIEQTEINYLIEADELLKIASDPNIKILDFRKPEFYAAEHIEGALNIWRPDIEDASYAYGGMMAGKEQIEQLFGNFGIHTNDTIIIYDDNGLCDSSRLWWILQNHDYTNVKLFHGGITAWKLVNGGVSQEVPVVVKTTFKLSDTPSMKYYVSKDDMLQAVNNETLIIDTRTTDEYSGKRQKKGAAIGGRIPKSILIDWANAVDYAGDKKMMPIAALDSIYNGLNVSKDDLIIAYCHSGVRSAHTTFVLTQLLGYTNVKNYDGSWTEWSHFNDLPKEQDSITTILK